MAPETPCDHVLAVVYDEYAANFYFVQTSNLYDKAEAERVFARQAVESNERAPAGKLYQEDLDNAIAYRDQLEKASDVDVLIENKGLFFCHCPNCGEKLTTGKRLVELEDGGMGHDPLL